MRDVMPAPASSSSAARADGAAPISSNPLAWNAARTASRVKVLPVPAGPIITETAAVLRQMPDTAAAWSGPSVGRSSIASMIACSVTAVSPFVRSEAMKRCSTSTSSRLVHAWGWCSAWTAIRWGDAMQRLTMRSIVQVLAPGPRRDATAPVRSLRVKVEPSAVRERTTVPIHSSGSTRRSRREGVPCSSNTMVSSRQAWS